MVSYDTARSSCSLLILTTAEDTSKAKWPTIGQRPNWVMPNRMGGEGMCFRVCRQSDHVLISCFIAELTHDPNLPSFALQSSLNRSTIPGKVVRFAVRPRTALARRGSLPDVGPAGFEPSSVDPSIPLLDDWVYVHESFADAQG
jgi:hypothetical protein